MKYIVLILSGILFLSPLHSQSLDKIGSQKPLKVSGGVSANQVNYFSNDTMAYRDPFTWVLTGSLNFNLYDWNVPLSYVISNYNRSFQQPFNQYGIHPAYKWVKVHAGYVSMSFSPYTLSGHTFYGIGVDLTPPGMFKFSAMYGRLRKTINPDTLNPNVRPSYKRMGYGFKAGITKNQHSVDFILFKAKDDVTSLNPLIVDSFLTPQENLILSVSGKTLIMNKITFSADIAGTSFTNNINSGSQTVSNGNIYSFSGLMKMRQSTSIHHALKANLSYALKKSNIGIGYERIDPGYTSLGTYYSNNDFENYTANASTSLFNNKISLSLSTGVQFDDLDNKKSSSTSRFVNSLNVGYTFNERLNLNGSYSNFSTVTNIRSQFENINRITPYENPDTLNYAQLSQSVNLNTSYAIVSNQDKRQSLSININYMVAKDKQASKVAGSDFLNTNISYNHCIVPVSLTITGSLNSCYNVIPDVTKSLILGPTLSLGKTLFNKTLRNTLSVSKNNSYANGKLINSCFIARISESYILAKKHNFSLNLVFSNRNSYSEKTSRKLNDFTSTMVYAYNF